MIFSSINCVVFAKDNNYWHVGLVGCGHRHAPVLSCECVEYDIVFTNHAHPSQHNHDCADDPHSRALLNPGAATWCIVR